MNFYKYQPDLWEMDQIAPNLTNLPSDFFNRGYKFAINEKLDNKIETILNLPPVPMQESGWFPVSVDQIFLHISGLEDVILGVVTSKGDKTQIIKEISKLFCCSEEALEELSGYIMWRYTQKQIRPLWLTATRDVIEELRWRSLSKEEICKAYDDIVEDED